MVWFLLFLAGLFEVAWAVGLKYSQGFSKFWPSLGTLLCMGISFFLLAKAMQKLPMGTAYAVWTGIGAVGSVLLGIIIFNEPLSWPRLLCLALIISGIAGLKLSSS